MMTILCTSAHITAIRKLIRNLRSRRLQLLHLFHCNAPDGPCQRSFGLDSLKVNPHLLRRLEPPHSPLQGLLLLLQLSYIMLRCRHLLLDGFQPLRRFPVLRKIHVRTATAQADDLKLMCLGDLLQGRFLSLHPGVPFRLLSPLALKALLL